MIIMPHRTVYPPEDVDGNPVKGNRLYLVVKWHTEMRDGTKYVVYEKLKRFTDVMPEREGIDANGQIIRQH